MAASAAVRPAAGYIGGKRNLAKRLVDLIESTPHRTYAEPFVGMGGVFLRRRAIARAEVINDISGDVVTLFRIVRAHYRYFLQEIQGLPSSRAEFARQLALPAEHLTDLERAVRFLYVQRLAFGGKVAGRNFGVSPAMSAKFDAAKLEPMLEKIHQRLSPVIIEQLPYADFIRRYDAEQTLFYLDPPYFGCEGDYGPGVFSPADFAQLAEQLAGIRGRFILSINDAPEVRRIFSRFSIEAVQTTYTVGGGGAAQKAGELIIRN